MRRALAAVIAAAMLVACDPEPRDETSSAPASAPAVTPASTGPEPVGPDPLTTWSPAPHSVGERSEGWLEETLLVTAPDDARLHVTPLSTSMSMEFVDDARSLAIWIKIDNVGDHDWSGVFGDDARLTDENGNTYLPVTAPTERDLHPHPERYGYTNRNLMRPIELAAGERIQGVLVFRPTLGNREAMLHVTLDGERTTSWVVNIGQL